MYDTPGADTGREWIEVENTGPESVDLAAKDFRFFDKGGKHLVSGGAPLAAGSLAVIADKPATFVADHPGFSGTVFDSVVSLTGTGVVGLMKGTDILDTVGYTETLGAKGDGNSLHRTSAGFVAAPANPGVAGTPAKAVQPRAVEAGTTWQEPANPKHDDTGTLAPTAEDTPAAVGASLAALPVAATTFSFPRLFNTPWFGGFLILLVFSGASLILIRRTYA